MTLFTNELCPYSHRIRFILAEKGVAADFIEVELNNKPDKLFELNPYGSLPTLVDRELVLYKARIISEYIDERFPHPPLLQAYPVAKARTRLLISRIEQDWYELRRKIITGNKPVVDKARTDLRDSLIAVSPVFKEYKYFLSDDFGLVDCIFAPLLWRLPSLGIELPREASPILDYARRIFSRPSFVESLSEAEKEIHA
ncbi:MAG: stringent starvation protein A [Thiotrichales bacterium]|nr:MAG: stringent starvation protein A [Thiotrichales bacterium]